MRRGARLKSNEVKILSIFIIAALICGVVGYNAFYQIKPNVNVLTEYIADIYSRGRDEQQSPEVSVYDNIEIGKASYYMLEINQELGIAKFRKGLNGKYKFESLSYSNNNFTYGIIEENGRKYFLFGARDPSAAIAEISVMIDGKNYTLSVPDNAGHFLLDTEIDADTALKMSLGNNITFYDKAGENITGQYNMNAALIS